MDNAFVDRRGVILNAFERDLHAVEVGVISELVAANIKAQFLRIVFDRFEPQVGSAEHGESITVAALCKLFAVEVHF